MWETTSSSLTSSGQKPERIDFLPDNVEKYATMTRAIYAIGIVIGATFLLAAALVAYWAASPEEREKAL